MATLNKSIFEAALAGLLAQRETIDNQIAEVRQYLNGNSTSTTAATAEKRYPASARSFPLPQDEKWPRLRRRRWASIKGRIGDGGSGCAG